jgi:hypothetical protein
MNSITYVTGYINIEQNSNTNKTFAWRCAHFLNIAKTGIKICLYADADSYEKISNLIEGFTNIKLMKVFHLEDIFSYKYYKP